MSAVTSMIISFFLIVVILEIILYLSGRRVSILPRILFNIIAITFLLIFIYFFLKEITMTFIITILVAIFCTVIIEFIFYLAVDKLLNFSLILFNLLTAVLVTTFLYVVLIGNLSFTWSLVFLSALFFVIFYELILYFGSLLLFIFLSCALIVAFLYLVIKCSAGWLSAITLYMLCGVWYVIRDLRKPGFCGHFYNSERELLKKKNKVAFIWPFCLHYDAVNPPMLHYSWKRRGHDEDDL